MDKKNETISSLEELITQLEKLSLSPLPSTNQDSQNMKKEVNKYIMKIVSKFDFVLSNKLRIESALKNITAETNHYWSFISKYYQIPSVKFSNIHNSVSKLSDKGRLWILLSISEKSLNESFKEIYNQNFDRKFYDKNSIIMTYKAELLSLSAKLQNIYLYDIQTEVNEEYFKYKLSYNRKEKGGDLNSELDMISPIVQKPNEKNIEITACPIEVIAIDKKNTFYNNPNVNSLFFSRATIDLQPFNNDPNDLNEKLGIDSLFLAIESDEEKTVVRNYTEGNQDEFNNNDHNAIAYMNTNPNSNRNNRINTQSSFKINEEKQIFFTKLTHSHQEKGHNINITKVSDFQSVYKEDFYSFKEKPKQMPQGILKKKDYNLQSSMDEGSNSNRYKNELILNPHKKLYFPFDKLFKVSKRNDKNVYTKKDLIMYNNKEISATNSVVFYLNNYYKKEPYYHFKTNINLIKPVSLESQNYQCAFCNKKYNTILNIPTEAIYWCCYYLKFSCRECISDDYSIIPAFILKSWNFKKFTISNKAKQLFQNWYKNPIIHFKQNDRIIYKCEKLHSALLIKRKIHKIFDLIKCDKGIEFAMKTLGDYQYLLMHENVLSLQDLIEINELTFFPKIREFLYVLQQHILTDCDICMYKGGRCIMCMSKEVIYAFDIENVIYCNDCRKMFHKKCCAVHPCIINR